MMLRAAGGRPGAAVVINGLSKSFAGVAALSDVSLDAAAGELLVIAGPSGCGKTTLLRSLAGLESLQLGLLQVDGRDLAGVAPHRRGMAMVFQEHSLLPHMTAAANIALPLMRLGLRRGEVQERVAAAAGMLGITDLLARRPDAMSGGERQRVAVARALVSESRLVLMDEPFASLDAQLRMGIRADFKMVQAAAGFTCLFVTHDQDEAMAIADRLALMREGRVIQVGRPVEVYGDPDSLFAASFLSVPAINLLSGRIQGGSLVCGEDRFALSALGPVPAKLHGEVVLAIRPQALVTGAGLAGKPLGQALVQAVEWTPRTTILSLRMGETALVAAEYGPCGLCRGESAMFGVRGEGVFWFDASGKRLR